jgi:hypothetical protein
MISRVPAGPAPSSIGGFSGGLVLGARLTQFAQQRGDSARVIEGGVCDSPAYGADVIAKPRRTPAEVRDGAKVSGCGSVLVELGGIPVQTPGFGGVPERGLVDRGDVIGCRSPELCRRDPTPPLLAAVLVQVVGEAVGQAGDRCSGLGRAGPDTVSGPRVPLQSFAV